VRFKLYNLNFHNVSESDSNFIIWMVKKATEIYSRKFSSQILNHLDAIVPCSTIESMRISDKIFEDEIFEERECPVCPIFNFPKLHPQTVHIIVGVMSACFTVLIVYSLIQILKCCKCCSRSNPQSTTTTTTTLDDVLDATVSTTEPAPNRPSIIRFPTPHPTPCPRPSLLRSPPPPPSYAEAVVSATLAVLANQEEMNNNDEGATNQNGCAETQM